MSDAQLYLCPSCGSPAISWDIDEAKVIKQGPSAIDFVCEACSWRGKQSDLVSSPFSHAWDNNQGLVDALIRDLRRRLAKDVGKSLLAYLMRWGFMTVPDTRLLARYLSAMSAAMVTAMMEERLKIEKEEGSAERTG
jgi:hypothetical protein